MACFQDVPCNSHVRAKDVDAELMLDATCRKTVLFAFYCLSCRVLDSSVQASFVKMFSKSSLVAMTSRDGNGTVSVHG